LVAIAFFVVFDCFIPELIGCLWIYYLCSRCPYHLRGESVMVWPLGACVPGVGTLIAISLGRPSLWYFLIIVWNIYIRKSFECMSSKGPVVCMTAMVLLFGDQGPYVGRMHMCRC
jgi:hypothetical protein